MDITPFIPKGKQIITGYGSGEFRINGIVHKGPLLILPSGAVPWNIIANKPITLESLQPVLDTEGEVELLLIGCMQSQRILTPQVKNPFKEAGISLEIMDTGAACRTFNILVGEGRRVAAAVVAI
jgi:uncharacterized protein